jgi:hypothetical protein
MNTTVIDLNKAWVIHCCKDRTLTINRKGEPAFNGRALPVYSVGTREEAEDLVVAVCRVQYGEHPQLPGQLWRKITLDGQLDFKPYLDVEDLDAVSAKLARIHQLIRLPEVDQR